MRTRVAIGDFSRASHLSVKTLRHYHEVWLLEPSEVDPDNGYRYYSDPQIPIAHVIRRLRGLHMPVADARSVLAAPDTDARNRLIVEHLDRLELEVAGSTGGLYASELFEHGRGEATVFIPTDGSVKTIGRVVSLIIPAAELAIARHHGSPSDIDLTYGQLGAYVINHEISVDGPLRENYLRGITETDDTGEWDTEIGWPTFRTHD